MTQPQRPLVHWNFVFGTTCGFLLGLMTVLVLSPWIFGIDPAIGPRL